MKIGTLTAGKSHEAERLVEAGQARGHEVVVLDLYKCSISVCPDDPVICYKGQKLTDDFDAIIPRIDVPHTAHGLNILRQFQALNIFTTDTAYAIELGRDKLRSLQYLMRRDVPFPTTGFVHAKEDFDNIINTVGGTPLIIKLIEGTEGIGVFLAEDIKQAKNLLKTFKQLDTPLIVQEFVEEAAGTDVRCFVVGGEIVAAMKRQSQDGDFRANIALGGHSFKTEITEEEREVILRAAEAVNLHIAGVDMIRSKKGPLILEINSAPDFTGEYGLEETSGVDVASCIIEYVEKGKQKFDTGKGIWLKDNKGITGWLIERVAA